MLAKILISKREEAELSIKNLISLIDVNYKEYVILEKPQTRKMSIEMFEKLSTVFEFDVNFKEQFVTPYHRYGDVFKKKREELGLSLGKLSHMTDVNRVYLWRLEQNQVQRISYSLFKRIQPALQIEDEENFEPFFLCNSSVNVTFINDGTFRDLIIEKRKKLKLSQTALAERINVSNTLISKYENEKRITMNYKTAIKIMDTLNFSEEERAKYLVYQRRV